MLAVVDELARGAIGKRGRPPAKLGSRLEHEDSATGVGQRGRGRQPGETAADDNDVGHHCLYGGLPNGGLAADVATRGRTMPGASNVRIQVNAAIAARLGRGTRTTSENTS